MQTAASNSLVLTDISSSKWGADPQTAISYGGFYQEIALGVLQSGHAGQVLRDLGNRLVRLAEHAYAFRKMDTLEQLSQALFSLPLPREYEPIGRYYQALGIQRFGNGDVAQAARLIGHLAVTAPPRFRVKAMISLAASSFYRGDHQLAAGLCREADIFASRNTRYDFYTTIQTQRMFALISSEDENHRDALSLLENLLPLAPSMRLLQPHVYCDYMNSLAVELCAVGRLEEAKNASEIALASPFAPAYPEWHETRHEIELRRRRASRSTVGVNHPVTETAEPIANNASPEAQPSSPFLAEPAVVSADVNHAPAEASNVLRFPVRGQNVGSVLARSSTGTSEPARVIVLSDRNKAVGRDSSTTTHVKKSYGDLDGRQLLLKIMELTAARDITDYELLEILESIESILYRQKDPGKP